MPIVCIYFEVPRKLINCIFCSMGRCPHPPLPGHSITISLSWKCLICMCFGQDPLPHHQNLMDVFISKYNPTSQDKWLAMIENATDTILTMPKSLSNLVYIISKTWTHTQCIQYKQWNGTTTTLKLILRLDNLLMSVRNDNQFSKCWVESIDSACPRQFRFLP